MGLPKRTAVIGAGTMGPGIAALLARRGSQVTLNDVSADVLGRAEGMCTAAEGVLDQLDVPVTGGGSVSFEQDQVKALDGAELVVEAIPEKLELKKQLLAVVESTVADDAIVGSNTSGIPVTAMAADMRRPERLIGMHWSNPPHVIPMIEVIDGDQTSGAVHEALVDVIESIGYRAVAEKEVPGFVENRVLYAIMRECLSLVDRGIVSREDLDTCVKWGIGFKLSVVGPMRLLDMAGLDIYESVASYLNPDLAADTDVPSLVRELTESGRLGMKTGGGMYEYGEGDVAATRGAIVGGLVAARKTLSTITQV